MNTEPEVPDVLDLCCGGKKCPVLRREGESIVIEDSDQAAGGIRLTREQVSEIVPWLKEWLDT